MKEPYFKKVSVRLGMALALIVTLFIIHSCRKEIRTGPLQTTLSADDISDLQSIYSKGIISGSGITVAAVGNSTFPNFVHNLTVKWDNYTINSRADNSQVVEFDMNRDTGTLTLKRLQAGDTIYYRNKTSAVFIKLNNGNRLNFFMKVIEDYSKTKNSVIGALHYRQIPATFSGEVIYYTLDRKFINGFQYSGGQITGKIAITPGGGTQQVAALKTNEYQDPQAACNNVLELDDYFCYTVTTPDDVYDGGCDETDYLIYVACVQQGYINPGVTGDSGSGGGGSSSSDQPPSAQPVVDTSKAPCTEVTKVNARAADPSIALENQRIALKLADPSVTDEWGVEQNIGTVGNFDYQYAAPHSDPNGGTTFQSVFYWEANKHTIGWAHDHIQGYGPDAEDIFIMGDFALNPSYNSLLTVAGAADMNFYKANVSITEMLPTGAYNITVHDWTAYGAIYNKYGSDPNALDLQRDAYARQYQSLNPGASIDQAQTYGMMKIFGSAINIYYQQAGQASYLPLYIDANNVIQTRIC